MKALIVGATGVAGSAAARAVKDKYGNEAEIIGLWYGPDPNAEVSVDGADSLFFADVSQPDALSAVEQKFGKNFDLLFYATARGDVGFPIAETTEEQKNEANKLSFDPIPMLEDRLQIGKIVGYSTFFTLRHQLICYGSMGHSKATLEQWVSEKGKSRRACIRAGAFQSDSSRGIKLLMRRNAKRLADSNDPLLRKIFNGSKPSEAISKIVEGVAVEEREVYGDTGTNGESLYKAHLHLLENPEALFVNVCGNKIWESSEPLRL